MVDGKRRRDYDVLSYDVEKIGSESVETRVRKLIILSAGFVSRMGNQTFRKQVRLRR